MVVVVAAGVCRDYRDYENVSVNERSDDGGGDGRDDDDAMRNKSAMKTVVVSVSCSSRTAGGAIGIEIDGSRNRVKISTRIDQHDGSAGVQ